MNNGFEVVKTSQKFKDYFREEEKETKEDKPDMTDFETFSNNFDKIEKQHRKAGKAMVKGGVSLKFNLFYNRTACSWSHISTISNCMKLKPKNWIEKFFNPLLDWRFYTSVG